MKKNDTVRLILLVMFLAGHAAPAVCQETNRIKLPDINPKVGGPDTTLSALQAYSGAHNRCPSLLKLDQDTAKLDTDVTKLSARLTTLSTRLDQLSRRLAIPKEVAAVLTTIEAQMTAAQKGAKAAEGVPQFNAKAKKFNAALTPALANVKAARTKAKAIADRLEPARKAAAALAGYSAKSAVGLNGFSSVVLKHEPDVTYCMQFSILYHADPTRTCVQQRADELAGKLDAAALDADKVILPLLTDLGVSAPALAALENFDLDLNAAEDMRRKAEALKKKLEPLCDAFEELNKKLNSSITVSIPYLAGSYDITVSMATILKGSAAVQDYLKDKLSGIVMTAANAFGFGKLVDKIVDAANSVMDKIGSRLDFGMDLTLPFDALNKVEAGLPRLEAVFPANFSIPQVDLNARNFGLPGVPAGLDLPGIGLSLKGVSPYCMAGHNNYLLKNGLGAMGCK